MGVKMTASAPQPLEFDGGVKARLAVLAALFSVLFWNTFNDLAYTWNHSADWSHGWIIPFFSAYLVYVNWERIRRTPVVAAWLGVPLMVLAMAAHHVFLWYFPANYLQQATMLAVLLGMIVLLRGVAVLRYAWLPWLYLFFAVPLPKAVYFALTDPLRRIAAFVAVAVLHMAPGLDDVERVGSIINYTYRGASGTIGVVDACSGMRSTITLCALGVAVTFITPRPVWQRIIMIAACVPIAVFSNFIRVTVTCVLYIFVNKEYAEGTYHTALGLVTLLIAFGIFSLLGWVLSHLVVAADDDDQEDGASDQPRPAPARKAGK